MFFPSKSLILGNLLRLHISRQSRLASLNRSHPNIKCFKVRIVLLQVRNGVPDQLHHHSLDIHLSIKYDMPILANLLLMNKHQPTARLMYEFDFNNQPATNSPISLTAERTN